MTQEEREAEKGAASQSRRLNFNVIVVHDGAREERLKKGQQPRRSIHVSRESVRQLFIFPLILNCPSTSVDPLVAGEHCSGKVIPNDPSRRDSRVLEVRSLTTQPPPPSPPRRALSSKRKNPLDVSNNAFRAASMGPPFAPSPSPATTLIPIPSPAFSSLESAHLSILSYSDAQARLHAATSRNVRVDSVVGGSPDRDMSSPSPEVQC
ncbi:hypothetical protein ACOMHN_065341 [Nucella lapillus]